MSDRPRLLDLFCGAGGATMGYHRAGFEVVGVDNRPQPHYPFEFHQADALTFPLDGFDVIHASPPCQDFSRTAHLARAQGRPPRKGDLLTPTRRRLEVEALVPWIIENVAGAPMHPHVTLCGTMFGLGSGDGELWRHRLFETDAPRLFDPPRCRHRTRPRVIGVYQRTGEVIPNGGSTARNVDEAREAMGIDWMTWLELKEAIPPAYTEWLGSMLYRAPLAQQLF